MKNKLVQRIVLLTFLLSCLSQNLGADDTRPAAGEVQVLPWAAALHSMPLGASVSELNRSNVVRVVLDSFQRNTSIKAVVFMPGATDEFYFFRRATAKLHATRPSLFDAIVALTNQTYVRATFFAPCLYLHTAEDPTTADVRIEDERRAQRLQDGRFDFDWRDKDWDFVVPILSFQFDAKIVPGRFSSETTHFFRHSMRGYGLTRWEALEAICLANKTRAVVRRSSISFEGDTRFLARPPVPTNWWVNPQR